MALVKKDVKYLNKDFAQFRERLVNFAKVYFPDTYTDFNESNLECKNNTICKNFK